MTRSVPSLVILLSASASHAQVPTIAWQRCLGSPFDENAYDVVQASDSSYVITGYSTGDGGNVSGHHGMVGIPDAWLCRLLPDGSIMTWAHSFGGSEDDNGMSVIQTADGGYLMAGYTRSTDGDVTFNHGDYDCWLVKTDHSGNMQWQHTYGGSGEDRANSVVQASDGGFVVTGYTFSSNGDVTLQHGIADLWIFKVNASGTLLWQHSYGGSLYETGNQIIRYKNGYAIIGYTFSTNGDVDDRGGSPCDYWLVITDDNGGLIEARSYGGTDFDVGTSLTPASNDGLVITGYSSSSDGDITMHHDFYDAWTLRLDDQQDIVWERSYGGNGYDEGWRVVADAAGFALAGYSDQDGGDVLGVNNIGYADYWIWHIDDGGNIQWQLPIGGGDDDQGYALVASMGGGWLVTGIGRSGDGDVANNHNPGFGDFWCVKLEEAIGTHVQAIGMATDGISWDAREHDLLLNNASGTGERVSVSVHDADGRSIAQRDLVDAGARIHLPDLHGGMYVATVRSTSSLRTVRFVVP